MYKIREINTSTCSDKVALKTKFYTKDSYHFKQRLKEIEIEEHFIQLSFNMRSVFPSVPVKQTLSLVRKTAER